ncbi:MAG: hypothetical protein E4H10_03215 [Bacteroidia bacterium]|nr:MAG: hypothetical protein E4H10_03215 [Bacteroidia bacterium]
MKSIWVGTGVLLTCLLSVSCDRNEHRPSISEQEFEVYESGWFSIWEPTIKASDADWDQHLTFEIIDGNTEGIFLVNPYTGLLSLNKPELLDYETVTQHFFKVAVSDNHERNPLESSAMIRINVLNDIELTDQLVAYYPFDGDATDKSGKQHHGEVNGALLHDDRDGQNESTYFFDGTDDYLDIPDHDDFSFSRGDFSISFWVQPLTHNPTSYILSKGGGDQNREYALGIDSDSLFFISVYNRGSSTNEYRTTSTTRVNYSDWYHVRGSWDGYMLSIFVNGKRESSQACNAVVGNYSSDLFIGTLDGEGHEASLHGVLDELYIHGRILMDHEFPRLYPEL